MTCRRCQGCMARDHFLDLQESGGEWWMEGWRCINCGNVFDPVTEQNRRMHAVAIGSLMNNAQQARPMTVLSEEELPLDIAA